MEEEKNKLFTTNNVKGEFIIFQWDNLINIACTTDHFKKKLKNIEMKDEIKLIELLNSSNIFLFVKSASPKLLSIFDHEREKIIGELDFPFEIISFKIFSHL